MRILITGSRDWADEYGLWGALDRYKPPHPIDVVLIHGDCPTGADSMGDDWAAARGVRVEKYPADWQAYGKRAGFIRNKQMVDMGADICLAFIKNNSRGATMTADMAETAGIPTRRHLE